MQVLCQIIGELKTDESGYLAAVLENLKQINRIFCDELAKNPSGIDVRQVLELLGNNCIEGASFFNQFRPVICQRWQRRLHFCKVFGILEEVEPA